MRLKLSRQIILSELALVLVPTAVNRTKDRPGRDRTLQRRDLFAEVQAMLEAKDNANWAQRLNQSDASVDADQD